MASFFYLLLLGWKQWEVVESFIFKDSNKEKNYFLKGAIHYCLICDENKTIEYLF